MTDLACADCGHNVVLHDGQGCTVSSCDCTTPPPPAARQIWRDPDGKPYMWSFFCGEHGLIHVAAEVPPSGPAMVGIHLAGCGVSCAAQPDSFATRRVD